MPKDLRDAIKDQVTPQVASPLADKVAQAFTGPWAAPLAAATKARKLADPTIVIGGARKVASGGASARQLVYGATWGGGSRVSNVTRRTRHGSTSYRARTTRQFRGKARDNIVPTIRREGDWVLDQFAAIVDDVLKDVTNG